MPNSMQPTRVGKDSLLLALAVALLYTTSSSLVLVAYVETSDESEVLKTSNQPNREEYCV